VSGNLSKSSASPILRNGWTKHFKDGTSEHGFVEDIDAGKASWSKGRLSGIKSVSSHWDGQHLCISGIGDYWQSDDYDVPLFVSSGEHVLHRIERRIHWLDAFIVEYKTEHSIMLRVTPRLEEVDKDQRVIQIKPEMHGYWIFLEYDLNAKKVRWGLSKEKI